MSLNGLDTDKVYEIYNNTISEPEGWFLLSYISRDEVDVYKSGKEGAAEVREAIGQYDQKSPLYGLLIYRRKKVLLKYVPEGTSRLLQVRLAVHLQSVIEKFNHDAIIPIENANQLTDGALSSSVSALKTSNSMKSLNSTKKKRLTEIVEVPGETSVPNTPRDTPEDPTFPAATTSTVADQKGDREDVASTSTTNAVHELDETTDTLKELPTPSPPSLAPELRPFVKQQPGIASPDHLIRPYTSQSNHSPNLDAYSQTYKPKVKLAPRPVPESRNSAPFERPTSTLPAGIQFLPREMPLEAASQQIPRIKVPPIPQSSNGRPLLPFVPNSAHNSPTFDDRPVSRGSAKTVPANIRYKEEPEMTPEKKRLMKALQKRKQQQKARQLAKEGKLDSEETVQESEGGSQDGSQKDSSAVSKQAPAPRKLKKSPPTTQPASTAEAIQDSEQRNSPVLDSIAESTSSERPRSTIRIVDSTTDLNSSVSNFQNEQTQKPATLTGLLINNDESIRAPLPPSPPLTARETGDKLDHVEEVKAPIRENTSLVDVPAATALVPSGEQGPASNKSSSNHISPNHLPDEAADNADKSSSHSTTPRQTVHAFQPIQATSSPTSTTNTAQLSISTQVPSRSTGRTDTSDSKPTSISTEDLGNQTRRSFIAGHSASLSQAPSLSDQDSLMEELRSATVVEATSVMLAKTPTNPYFPTFPRQAETRRVSENNPLTPSLSTTMGPSSSSPGYPSASSSEAISRTVTPDMQARLPKYQSREVSPQSANPYGDLMSRSRQSSFSPSLSENDRPSSRKSTVSSLISQRIKAFEDKFSASNAPQQAPTSAVKAQLVTLRKISLNTPSSSGNGNITTQSGRSTPSSYPTPSPSPHNFVQRWGFSKTPKQENTNKKQSQQNTTSKLNQSVTDDASSMAPSIKIAPEEPASPPAKTKRSFFSGRPSSRKSKNGSTSSMSSFKKGPRLSVDAPSARNSISPAPNTPDTIGRSRSPSSVESLASNGETKDSKRKPGLLKRLSQIGTSTHRSIAETMNATVGDLPAAEEKKPSDSKLVSLVTLGDLNIQFPDTLLWKRRYVEIDAQGFLVLSAPQSDKHSKVAMKRYHVADFRPPYVPEPDREELPYSVNLDFLDGNTLQCACYSPHGQQQVYQALVTARDAFSA